MEKIRVGISDYDELFFTKNVDSANELSIINLISEPFVRMYDGKIWPAIAKSWQVFDDGHRWLFYLHTNSYFSDSTKCTMIDIMDSIECAKAKTDVFGLPSPYTRYLRNCSFRTVNRFALEVICEEPSGDVAEMLSGIPILKPNRQGKPLIGTGNYLYSKYWPGKSVRLTKKSDLKHLSAYEQITFFIIPDPEERLEALKTGKIHFAASLEQLDKLPDNTGYLWWKCVTNHSVMGILNAWRGPFRDPVARQAINYAIDKERIIKEIINGLAIPASTVVSPYHCGFGSTLTPYSYDPEKAKRMFDKVEMGSDLVITVSPGFPNHSQEIGKMIIFQLAEIGITAHLEKIANRNEYKRNLVNKKAGDISLLELSTNSTYKILMDYVSSIEKGPMWQGIEDEVLAGMIHGANIEGDITERERKYSEVLRYVKQNPPWLYLFHPISAFACIPEVRDVELLHTGVYRFPSAW